jgi:excisionase family DNA binding protein
VEVGVTADLSPSQAAEQTGLSRTLIYREIERGHLCAYKVGGRLRITAEALAEWKRRHTGRSAPAGARLRAPARRPRGAG